MPQQLTGKSALVTGASRGIGRATALRLARDGAFVLVHYGSSKAAADAVVAEIKKNGGDAVSISADLAQHKGALSLADEVRRTLAGAGRKSLDILVNNAGVAEFVDFANTSEETFDRAFAVNVKAPYFLTQALLDLLPPGGRVIFTTSVVTDVYFPGVPAYAASKGAVDTIIRYLAGELGGRGIRVNGVAPGAIETDMAAWMASDEGKQQAKSIQALQDVGSPAEIADVVAFLAGPDSRWLTGAIVNASGGTKL